MVSLLKISLMSLAVLNIGTVNGAERTGYPFDESYKQVEERMAIELDKCSGFKNPAKVMGCDQEVRKKYRQEGKARGSMAWAERTYGEKGTKELEQLRVQLIKQRDIARSSSDFSLSYPKPPGELVKEDFGVEISVIEELLRKRGRNRDESNLRRLDEISKGTR